jgi:hypothetical protein
LTVWQKNDQKVTEKEIKKGYHETPGTYKEQKESQNAFYLVDGRPWQASAHSNSPHMTS